MQEELEPTFGDGGVVEAYRDAYAALARAEEVGDEEARSAITRLLEAGMESYEDFLRAHWPKRAEELIAESGQDAVAAINALVDMFNDEREELLERWDTEKMIEYFTELEGLIAGDISPDGVGDDEEGEEEAEE